MLVRERMISPGKRISANLPIDTAIEAYKSINSSWLPVVDPEGTLVGLLTPADIQKAKAALENNNCRSLKTVIFPESLPQKSCSGS